MELDYRQFTSEMFSRVFGGIAEAILSRYTMAVKVGRLELNITGDFDGQTIVVREDMDEDLKLFILLHLFGHSVQFNTSEQSRIIGLKVYGPEDINPATLEVIRDYEGEAARYGLWLLHQVGVTKLDQWVSDWSNGDLEYLVNLYRTGTRYELTREFLRSYKEQWIRYGTSLIYPLPVPDFVPQKWQSRFSF